MANENQQPFAALHPVNPSWEIAKSLPPFLPPSLRPATDNSYITEHPPVRILVHPEQVEVAYKTVRQLVPKLWEGRKVDYMVHIGMATGRRFYSVERRGHRDGYKMKDVNGQFLEELDRQEKHWTWAGMPDELQSSCDIDDTWRRWRVALPDTDIRISEDAGRYLCDFIYFSSLAHLEKHGEERRVVFFHVPVDVDEKSIQTGIDTVVELIRAMVQSGRMKSLVEKAAKSERETVVDEAIK